MLGKNLLGPVALAAAMALALTAGCTEQKKDETENGAPPSTQEDQQGMSGMSGMQGMDGMSGMGGMSGDAPATGNDANQ